MQLKISTKEKFHAISLLKDNPSDNLTIALLQKLQEYLHNTVKNVVFNMSGIESIEISTAEQLVSIQQKYYENNASFVICELSKNVEEQLDNAELLELMNVTPTESEAYDIVQMEEVERELLGDM